MGIVQKSKSLLKYGTPGYVVYKSLRNIDMWRRNLGSDYCVIRRKYKKVFGKYPDLDNPKSLNEKIQWIKLHDHRDEKTVLADKYLMRNCLIQKFGDEVKPHLIPLLFSTADWREITLDNLPDEPFVIKANHSSQQTKIIHDKSKICIEALRQECRAWLNTNFYFHSQEWQYRDIPRRIVVEKMLQTKTGAIPNDYKLHFFNGNLEFVYCSIDREGANTRNIYDADWHPLHFSWSSSKRDENKRGPEIQPPASFEQMRHYGQAIAQNYDYVRCDFFDVDGQMYFGEVTFHHGGGLDVFNPPEYDLIYGQKLQLTIKRK